MKSRPRRTLLVAAVAAVMVLALGASGAVGMLIARQPSGPSPAGRGPATVLARATATIVPTAGLSAVASVTVATTPTVVPPTYVPASTATPLLTPTIVVSSSPLHATQIPSLHQNNCFATQKLTNISAVDAQWSWSNTPSNTGWKYSTVG